MIVTKCAKLSILHIALRHLVRKKKFSELCFYVSYPVIFYIYEAQRCRTHEKDVAPVRERESRREIICLFVLVSTDESSPEVCFQLNVTMGLPITQ